MKKKKNILVLLFLFLSIGVTIVYLQSTDTFENIFNAGTYSVITHEEFTSPDNWKPGDTTPKTITTTNEGTIPVRVRVKLDESWISSNNNPLDLTFENYINALQYNTEYVSIINFVNQEDWIKDGDYYYYVAELAPGETTSSLIESVTFNPAYNGDINCTTADNVKTCESSSDGYMGGTYTLNITTETVQSDAYQEVWNLSYNPTEERTIYDISNNTEYGTYEATNKNVFLRKTMLGETPIQQEVGFVLNGNVYYLKSGGTTYNEQTHTFNNDSIYYEENKTTLLSAFGSENCTDNTTHMSCQAGSVGARAYDSGNVGANDGDWYCYVDDDGSSVCHRGEL